MSFFILMDQITTIFLRLGLLTTMTFNSEITSYIYGGSADDLHISIANNMKTLTLKPKVKDIGSNLLVITKTKKYYFNVGYDKSSPHKFIEVGDGQINHAMKKSLSTSNFEILEGSTSLLFINKRKNPVIVNEKKITTKGYFSKGVPLIIGGRRVFN